MGYNIFTGVGLRQMKSWGVFSNKIIYKLSQYLFLRSLLLY